MVSKGKLPKPIYHGVAGKWTANRCRPEHTWAWDEIIAQVREDAVARMRRGQPPRDAVIGLYKEGGRERTKADRHRDYISVTKGLQRNFPKERWVVMQRTIPSTWYHRQLVVRFEGFMTDEEAEAERLAHKARWHEWHAKMEAGKLRRRLATQAERTVEAERLRQAVIRERGAEQG